MPEVGDLDLLGSSAAQNATGIRDESMGRDVEPVTLAVQIIPVAFLMVGGVGNVITVVALYRCKELSAGCRVYHTNLCLSDMLALLLSDVRLWLLALVPLDLTTVHNALCRLLPWLELSALMTPTWILVAMVMQVQEGLGKNHAPGANITRCKALVYSATALATSLVIHCPAVFLFSLKDNQPNNHHDNHTNNRTNDNTPTFIVSDGTNNNPSQTDSDPSSTSDDGGCRCSAISDDVAVFADDVWPWFSVAAALLIPLAVLVAGFVLIMRRVCLRCRRHDHVTSPQQFTTLTVSVQVLSCFTFITSILLCGFSLSDPGRLWTDYGEMFVGGKEDKGSVYSLSCVFRLVFIGHFAVRWFVICCCCQLWSIVGKMCRKNSSS